MLKILFAQIHTLMSQKSCPFFKNQSKNHKLLQFQFVFLKYLQLRENTPGYH